MNKVKITVEYIDDNGATQQSVFEYDQASFIQERGLICHHLPTPSGYLEPVDFAPNGHSRFNLQAWSGCKDFDSFIAREDK